MEDPLVDSEILHSGEDRDLEWWLEPRNNSFMFAPVSCYLLLFIIHTMWLFSCMLLLLSFHHFYYQSITHLNKEAIEHLNS